MISSLVIFLASDPFASLRASFATLIQALLGFILLVSLAVVIVHALNGDREAAKKVGVWMIVTVVGFILISIFKSL